MTRLFAAAALAIVTATGAPAAIIQLTALGTITGGTQAGPAGLDNLGDAARFDLVYDTSVPDTSPAPFFGQYSGAFVSATARFDTIDINPASGLALDVISNPQPNVFQFVSSELDSVFGLNQTLNFNLNTSTSTIFLTDALPTGPLTATDFTRRTFGLVASNASPSVLATIDTITVTDITPVPLPAGGGLLLGALGLAALARRRRV